MVFKGKEKSWKFWVWASGQFEKVCWIDVGLQKLWGTSSVLGNGITDHYRNV